MGKIEIREITYGNADPRVNLRVEWDSPKEVFPIEIFQKQLESFQPGGAVERLVDTWKFYCETPSSECDLATLEKAFADVEALLPKEGEAGK